MSDFYLQTNPTESFQRIIDLFLTNDKSPNHDADDIRRFIILIGKKKVNKKAGF